MIVRQREFSILRERIKLTAQENEKGVALKLICFFNQLKSIDDLLRYHFYVERKALERKN